MTIRTAEQAAQADCPYCKGESRMTRTVSKADQQAAREWADDDRASEVLDSVDEARATRMPCKPHTPIKAAIYFAYLAGLAAEREACAEVAMVHIRREGVPIDTAIIHGNHMAEVISAAIRNRAKDG